MLSAEGYTSCWRPCRIRLAAAIGRKFAPIISKERARERRATQAKTRDRPERRARWRSLATERIYSMFTSPSLSFSG